MMRAIPIAAPATKMSAATTGPMGIGLDGGGTKAGGDLAVIGRTGRGAEVDTVRGDAVVADCLPRLRQFWQSP
jgi:hypothetical protein